MTCSIAQPSFSPLLFVYFGDSKDRTPLLHLPALCGKCSGHASSSSLSAFLHAVSLTAFSMTRASTGTNAERSQVPFTIAPKLTSCRTAVPGHQEGPDVHPPHSCFHSSPCTQRVLCAVQCHVILPPENCDISFLTTLSLSTFHVSKFPQILRNPILSVLSVYPS